MPAMARTPRNYPATILQMLVVCVHQQKKTGNRLARFPATEVAKSYFFLQSIMSCKIGERMISIA